MQHLIGFFAVKVQTCVEALVVSIGGFLAIMSQQIVTTIGHNRVKLVFVVKIHFISLFLLTYIYVTEKGSNRKPKLLLMEQDL